MLEHPGHTDPALRQRIAGGDAPPDLAPLVAKIRQHAYRISDADVDALRGTYTEDQLFEIIIAATLGAAEHRLTRAMAAVEQA